MTTARGSGGGYKLEVNRGFFGRLFFLVDVLSVLCEVVLGTELSRPRGGTKELYACASPLLVCWFAYIYGLSPQLW